MSGKIYEPKGKALEYAPDGLALNLYKGCTHGCKYCYVPGIPPWKFGADPRGTFHSYTEPFKNCLGKVYTSAAAYTGSGRRVLLSFTSDPYQKMEEELQITRRAIQTLHDHSLKVEILTKGGLLATRDFDLLGDGDAIAATLTFACDDSEWQEWEPRAAPPSERMEMLRQAHKRGIRTWASFEPVIYPHDAIEIIEVTYEYIDFYKIGKLNYIDALPDDLRARVVNFDWVKFTHDVVAVCDQLSVKYMLKDSLKPYLKRLI